MVYLNVKDLALIENTGAGEIAYLSFSQDGKTITAGGSNLIVASYDVSSGKEMRKSSFIKNVNTKDNNFLFAYSLNADYVAIGINYFEYKEGVKIFEVATGKQINVLKVFPSEQIALSPDGKTIAILGNKIIKVVDISTAKELQVFDSSSQLSPNGILSMKIKFSPDGKRVAQWYDNSSSVKIWEIKTATSNSTSTLILTGHNEAINSLAYSQDGKTLASGSKDKTIKLWDAEAGKEIVTLKGHSGFINSVAFSPDGKTLASGSSDKTIKLWEVPSGKELKTLSGHTKEVNSVAFSPDGKTVASQL